jgi:hypothetical protein
MVNFNFSDECVTNRTIAKQIKNFKRRFKELRYFSDDQMLSIENQGFEKAFPEICEAKRKITQSITDCIEHITNQCVSDVVLQKKFKLNTLLMLQTFLDFVCSMKEDIYIDIFQNKGLSCFRQKDIELNACRSKAFRLLFFEKVPIELYWISLINGSVCK